MNITNLVMAVVALQTNVQAAITGYTNGAAIITYVEQVQRVETITWPPTQRRWSEIVQDLTKRPPPGPGGEEPPLMKQPIAEKGPVPRPVLPTNNPALPPPLPKLARPGANTNSPAFKRRAEMEARRAEILKQRQTTNAPAVKPAPAK